MSEHSSTPVALRERRSRLSKSKVEAQAGERVRERREALGLTKIDLASAAGVNRDTLSDLENGAGFQSGTLKKVESALDAAEETARAALRRRRSPRKPSTPSAVESTGRVGTRSQTSSATAQDWALVEFAIEGAGGVRFHARGPVESIHLLHELALQVLASRPATAGVELEAAGEEG
jgi:transcriptional regulator with XRE-family HTH domain